MKTRKWLRKGFTLIEILAVVAVMSVLASAGYHTVTSVQETARESKLETDVAALNSAVQIYRASGGTFDGVSGTGAESIQLALNKLKVKGDEEAQSKFNGLTGSTVDARINPGAAASSGKRVYWDLEDQRFEITEGTGPAGVKEFVLSDSAAADARALDPNDATYIRADRAMDAANVKSGPVWVWDHTSASALAQNAVVNPNPETPPAVTGSSSEGTPTPAPTTMPTPTPVATATPTPTATPGTGGGSGSAVPAGALIGSGEFQNDALFQGNITVIGSSNLPDTIINGAARLSGNLYLPGTPTIIFERATGGFQTWTAATDAQIGNNVLGKQFTEGGSEVIPPDASWLPNPRVVDLTGDVSPSDYEVRMQRDVRIAGKIYRRTVPVQFPIVAPPVPKTNNVSRQYDSWTLSPSNPGRYTTTVDPSVSANFALRTNATLTVLPGAYGNVVASNGGKLILGNASNPEAVSYYSFESLDFNTVTVEVVGKVVITSGSAVRVDNNSIVGNPDHPEWLQLNIYNPNPPNENTAQFNVFSTGAFYGQVVAPKGIARLDNGAKFTGSITAYKMAMFSKSGTDVRFTLPPISGP